MRRKGDIEQEKATLGAELAACVEIRTTQSWVDFRAILERKIRTMDSQILDLANDYDKNRTAILYKTAVRNLCAFQIDALERTMKREDEVREKIGKLETILQQTRKLGRSARDLLRS